MSRSAIEEAMSARAAEATAVIKKHHPGCLEVLKSFFEADLILDVKDKDGEWFRYRYVSENDLVAIEIAEQSGRRKNVHQGELV